MTPYWILDPQIVIGFVIFKPSQGRSYFSALVHLTTLADLYEIETIPPLAGWPDLPKTRRFPIPPLPLPPDTEV